MKTDQKSELAKLVREIIAEGFALEVPDEEIARVVSIENADILRRLNALETAASAAKASTKPARLNVLASASARGNGGAA